jgi:hypothetical protein
VATNVDGVIVVWARGPGKRLSDLWTGLQGLWTTRRQARRVERSRRSLGGAASPPHPMPDRCCRSRARSRTPSSVQNPDPERFRHRRPRRWPVSSTTASRRRGSARIRCQVASRSTSGPTTRGRGPTDVRRSPAPRGLRADGRPAGPRSACGRARVAGSGTRCRAGTGTAPAREGVHEAGEGPRREERHADEGVSGSTPQRRTSYQVIVVLLGRGAERGDVEPDLFAGRAAAGQRLGCGDVGRGPGRSAQTASTGAA